MPNPRLEKLESEGKDSISYAYKNTDGKVLSIKTPTTTIKIASAIVSGKLVTDVMISVVDEGVIVGTSLVSTYTHTEFIEEHQ